MIVLPKDCLTHPWPKPAHTSKMWAIPHSWSSLLSDYTTPIIVMLWNRQSRKLTVSSYLVPAACVLSKICPWHLYISKHFPWNWVQQGSAGPGLDVVFSVAVFLFYPSHHHSPGHQNPCPILLPWKNNSEWVGLSSAHSLDFLLCTQVATTYFPSNHLHTLGRQNQSIYSVM